MFLEIKWHLYDVIYKKDRLEHPETQQKVQENVTKCTFQNKIQKTFISRQAVGSKHKKV